MIDTKSVLSVTEQHFDKVIAEGITLIDFWAPWCGPCRMQGPIIEKLAAEIGDKITIAKLDVDDNPVIAARYEIMSIPTIAIFKNGQPVKKLIGLQSEQVLRAAIEEQS